MIFTTASFSSYKEYSRITFIINTFLTEDLNDIFQHCFVHMQICNPYSSM